MTQSDKHFWCSRSIVNYIFFWDRPELCFHRIDAYLDPDLCFWNNMWWPLQNLYFWLLHFLWFFLPQLSLSSYVSSSHYLHCQNIFHNLLNLTMLVEVYYEFPFLKHQLPILEGGYQYSIAVQEWLHCWYWFSWMKEELLGSRIDFLNAGITGIFELFVVISIFLDECDGSFEVTEFSGIFNPFEVNCL